MNALPPNQRPHTAPEVAEYSQDSEAFGRAVRDWQHELRKLSRRQDFVHAFTKRPKLLAEQLHDDGLADAYLAAYVEYACNRFGLKPPNWVYEAGRISRKPWFTLHSRSGRARLLLRAPSEFRERDLFTVPDLPFGPRAGRPRKSSTDIRASNAARQKRYRARKKLRQP